MTISWIPTSVSSASKVAMVGLCAGALLVAQGVAGAQPAQAAECVPAVESHQFSGSSTAVDAFTAWFNGGEFVAPTIETRDLNVLRVNGHEEAFAGDIISKDAHGHFFVGARNC